MQIAAISNNQNQNQNFGLAQTSFNKNAEALIKRKLSPKNLKKLGHLMSTTDQNTQYVQKIEFITSKKSDKRLCANISGKNDTTIIEATIQQSRFQPVMRFIRNTMKKAAEIENELNLDTIELF